MLNINIVLKSISEIDAELSRLFKTEIEDYPVFFKNFELFGNKPGAVSLRSGIYVHEKTANLYNVIYMIFIFFHEIGHYKRYNNIDYDMVSLTKLPIDDYIKQIEIEENFANDFAIKKVKELTSKIPENPEIQKQIKEFMEYIYLDIKVFNPNLYHKIYNTIKSNIEKYEGDGDKLVLDILSGKVPINENKKIMNSEKAIRNKIAETLRQIFEKTEVAPAKPVVKPDVKPAPEKPNPRRLTKLKIHPGADLAPKAENKNSLKKKAELKEKKIQESLIDLAYKLYILKEAPLQYSDDEMGSPSPEIKKNIEQRGSNPFSKIDILHKDVGNNQKSIEKLSDEEYKDVIDTAKKHGATKINPMQQMDLFMKAMVVQEKYKDNLEQLAKDVVKKYFGIPDDVMENIHVKLTNNQADVQLDKPQNQAKKNQEKKDDENNDNENNNDDLDNNKGFQELVHDFTPEEKEIIKQNVDKRTIANALMMGAGFRAHNLMDKIKPALDAIDPVLFPFYSKIMSGGAVQIWKSKPQDDGSFEMDAKDFGLNIPGMPQKFKISSDMLKKMGVVGKSELILGDDKNGDGIREVEGARAIAMIFPVLLHETVKACVEYIFASGLPQYTERINREIMRQSDDFKFEYWHKLLGPRLWKYLHDAIDYIVQGRNQDYTIVAYLLQEISMLPPDKFLRLIDLLIHDGAKGIVWLEKMLDRVENDLQNVDIDKEPIPQADFGNIQNLMGQIQNLLNQKDIEPKPDPIQQKPFNKMTTEELRSFILDSINSGDFDKAAEARDELEGRGE
jgi:hypothetical protein